jgi:hypothetical protein
MGRFHVRRTRTSDEPLIDDAGPIVPGTVRHSRTFFCATKAQREAARWNGAWSWSPPGWCATVVPGPAPKQQEV